MQGCWGGKGPLPVGALREDVWAILHVCIWQKLSCLFLLSLHDKNLSKAKKKKNTQPNLVLQILKVVSDFPGGGALTQLTVSLTLSPDSPNSSTTTTLHPLCCLFCPPVLHPDSPVPLTETERHTICHGMSGVGGAIFSVPLLAYTVSSHTDTHIHTLERGGHMCASCHCLEGESSQKKCR